MNEDQARKDENAERPNGRPDFRRGGEVPGGRSGKSRAPRSEEEMREAVNRALSAERELAGANLQVEVHDGVILLRGRVQNARMRALAEDCLDEISYVHVIRNEIEVRVGAGGFPSAGAPTGPVLPGEGLEAEPLGKRDGRSAGHGDLPLCRSA